MAARSSKTAAKHPARVNYAAVAAEVRATKRRRVIPGQGVAMVPLADLRRLRELEREDRDDVAAIEASMRDPRPSVPWESVKAELGL